MQHLPESELILNDRGAIYHLDLRPEELAPLVITVGDPFRVSEISKHFDHIEFKGQHREFISHTGTLNKTRLTVVSTGIGPDNIDIVLNELDALVNIDFKTRTIREKLSQLSIVRIGTSGSLQPDIPVDSHVAGTHGLGIDNLLHFYRHSNNEEEKQIAHAFVTHTQMHHQTGTPYVFGAAPGLLKKFVQDFFQGITVTCPGFYGPQGRVLRLGLAQPAFIDQMTSFRFGSHRISNFEMETSAIYGLCRLLGHQALAVNAIIANRVSKTYSKNPKHAVENLIVKTLGILTGNEY
jgi:uridine phosphorylase